MSLITLLDMRYPTETSKNKSRYALFLCPSCDQEFEAIKRNDSFNDRTCKKCSSKENATTHGKGKTKLNRIWNAMKSRVLSETNAAYKNYGARGITICDEWINDFTVFDKWANTNGYKEGLQLDRKDNNKGYSPSNCRFVPKEIQARNTRLLMSTNTSGYRGVSLKKATNKYYAAITVNNKTAHLGYFITAKEAAKAYNDYVDLHNLEHTKNIL